MVATIVSVMPFGFREEKPGLAPGDFALPAASETEPRFIHVRTAQIRMMDQDFRPFMMEIPVEEVAADVVKGFASAQIGYTPDAQPGIFWVPGEITTKEELIKHHKAEWEEAVKKQRNWFLTQVKIADDDWSRWHQHKYISDLQRAAARTLALEREWLMDSPNLTRRCGACQTVISSEAAVCFACKAIVDEKKYAQFKFAG